MGDTYTVIANTDMCAWYKHCAVGDISTVMGNINTCEWYKHYCVTGDLTSVEGDRELYYGILTLTRNMKSMQWVVWNNQ